MKLGEDFGKALGSFVKALGVFGSSWELLGSPWKYPGWLGAPTTTWTFSGTAHITKDLIILMTSVL